MIDTLTHIIALLIGAAIVFALTRTEIQSLRRQNSDLQGSLFHRVGFKPEREIQNVSENDDPVPRDKYQDGVPDVLKAQKEAVAANLGQYGEYTPEEWHRLPSHRQVQIIEASKKGGNDK